MIPTWLGLSETEFPSLSPRVSERRDHVIAPRRSIRP
jgi:hypothetical protein